MINVMHIMDAMNICNVTINAIELGSLYTVTVNNATDVCMHVRMYVCMMCMLLALAHMNTSIV